MYELTPREFANYAKGQENVYRARERMDWERTRYMAWVMARTQGAKIQSPRDMFLLDHERPTKTEQEKRREAIENKFPKQIDG